MTEQRLTEFRPKRTHIVVRWIQAPLHWLEGLSNRQFGIALLLPATIMVVALYAYPLLFSIIGSFQDRDPFGGASPFVGLDNYRRILSTPEFWAAFKNDLVYAGSTVLLQLLVGSGVALLLQQKFRGNLIARTMVILPYVMAPVGTALVWKWLLNDILGLANFILIKSGLIGHPIAFLGDRNWAMATVIGISVWKFFPFVTICVLARLETIPGELYDAAKVDGAGTVSRFIYVTLPQLRGVLFIVLLLRSIWMFNSFEMIWLLTQGGPLGYTKTLPIYIYEKALLGAFEVSYGMAGTMLMLLFLIVVAAVYFRVYKVEEEIA